MSESARDICTDKRVDKRTNSTSKKLNRGHERFTVPTVRKGIQEEYICNRHVQPLKLLTISSFSVRSVEIESSRLTLVVSWLERNSDDVSRLICPYHACSLAERTLDNTEKRASWRANQRRNRRLDRSASKTRTTIELAF